MIKIDKALLDEIIDALYDAECNADMLAASTDNSLVAADYKEESQKLFDLRHKLQDLDDEKK